MRDLRVLLQHYRTVIQRYRGAYRKERARRLEAEANAEDLYQRLRDAEVEIYLLKSQEAGRDGTP
jgi:hypothetical protein